MSFYYKVQDREVEEDGRQVADDRPTENPQGAWNDREQHMAPATGVICAELEYFRPEDNMRYARISLDILGMIHLSDFKITTRCIPPCRNIELNESIL